MEKNVSVRQLERYPIYLRYFISLKEEGIDTISSPVIAKAMKCSEEQVRKDLQAISTHEGKPRYGRDVSDIINDLELFLGYNKLSEAIIVGAGHLGGAYLNYKGFDSFGLKIKCAFDNDKNKIGQIINGKCIYSIDELETKIKEYNIKIALLTVPSYAAQDIADILVKSGIKAIWNFTSVQLKANDDVAIESVNLASSFAVLTHKMNEIKNGNY